MKEKTKFILQIVGVIILTILGIVGLILSFKFNCSI